MIKFLHAADFHLDAAFSALTGEQAALRRREQREILDELAELCRDCELVLLSGDLFDGAHVYRDTLDALKRFFAAVPGEIFIAPGNHDALVSGSPYLTEDWGENVHIFTDEAPQCIALPRLGCNVYGAAFHGQSCPPPLEHFHVDDPAALNIMVLHGDLQPGSPYAPITPDQIAASGLDYLALGHIHTPRSARLGATLAAYPGCLMGRGFDELGEKGILTGTVERGKAELSFVPFARRRYEILNVDVTGRSAEDALRASLPDATVRDIYRIIFTGETDERGLDLKSIEEQFAPDFFHLELRDETRIGEDVWARAQEDSLRGLFLRELRTKFDVASSDDERAKISLAARFGLAALDGCDL